MTADEWLRAHGLTVADVESVGGRVNKAACRVPAYTVGGQYAFTVTRQFEAEPKYLYAPHGCRTGMLLYGLWHSLTACLDTKQIVLVEGFSDALACWKAGLPQTAALLGSNLSRVQRATAKLAGVPVIWADGDDAGVRAAERMQAHDPTLRAVAVWGMDPAEACVRLRSAELPSIIQCATTGQVTVLKG